MKLKNKIKRIFEKVFYKKVLYEFTQDCHDEFFDGEYQFYFKVIKCYSLSGISYSIDAPDITTNQKKLSDCMNAILKHLELDNPRYYRLKERIYDKKLHKSL